MRKLTVLLMLLIAAIISIAGNTNYKTPVIKTGTTMPTKDIVCTDTLIASSTDTIMITNLQRCAQMQYFTVALTQIAVTPSVTITAFGKVTSSSAWVQIGTPITWASTSNNGTISSTSPINYNYLMLTFVASGAVQKSKITTCEVKCVNAFEIPTTSGTVTFSRPDAGTVTIQAADDNTNAAAIFRAGGTGALTLGASTGTTTIISSGSVSVVGAINSAIAGGTNVVSAGLLGGGGTSTSATQTLGAAGGKAFSYYLSSTSTTASDNLIGYYMNMNYGTAATSAAPSGDVIRGRAYLVGDAAGGNAITGGAFSVELATNGASNTGLTVGMRGNLVLPDGILTNAGTYYGAEAEINLGGAATNTTAYTEIAPLAINISGTAPTSVAQLSNMVAMAINVPANMVTSTGTMVVTGATGPVNAGLKILINGIPYWIMLATQDAP
jgi:hypothetical protein